MIDKSPGPGMLTGRERELGAWVATGELIEPGDVLVFLGRTMRIDHVTPHIADPMGFDGSPVPEGSRVAWVGGRPYITLVPGQQYRILPRPEQSEVEQ